jgi:hypothetical protein
LIFPQKSTAASPVPQFTAATPFDKTYLLVYS